MMSYLLSSLVPAGFHVLSELAAWLDCRPRDNSGHGLVSKRMNKVSLREAAGRQEQSERLTDAVLSFVEGIGVIKSYNLLGEKSEELTGNFKRSRNTSLALREK